MGLFSSSAKSSASQYQATDGGLTGVAEDSNLSQSRAGITAGRSLVLEDESEINIISTTTDAGAVEGSLALAGGALDYSREYYATAADLLENTFSRAIGAQEETFDGALNFADNALDKTLYFAEDSVRRSNDAYGAALGFAENAFEESFYFAGDQSNRSYDFAERALDAVAGQGGIIDRQTEAVQGTLSDILGQQATALGRVVESQGETNAERIEQLTKIALYAGAALAAVWIFKG